MPSFSARSQSILNTVDPRLQEICLRVIEHYDFTVLSGFRTKEEQDDLFAEGKTTLAWPKSKHNQNSSGQSIPPSRAVDVAPYPIDWNDSKRFIFMAGLMFQAAHDLGYKIRWGGNWDNDDVIIDDQNFDDLPHFELIE